MTARPSNLMRKCMTRGPSHFNLAWKSTPFVLVVSMLPGRGREVGSIPTRSKLVFHAMNQRQRELLYGVRSTDWAENPQVACDWSGATSDARITTSYQCVNSTIGLINYCWQKYDSVSFENDFSISLVKPLTKGWSCGEAQ